MIEWIVGTVALGLLGSMFGSSGEPKKTSYKSTPTKPLEPSPADSWTKEMFEELDKELQLLVQTKQWPAISSLHPLVIEASGVSERLKHRRTITSLIFRA